MRVVVNQLTALGKKTGIGHYVQQLLRCLREQAEGDQIEAYPAGWMGRLCRASLRARAKMNFSGGTSDGPFLKGLKSQLLDKVRQTGIQLLGRHFQAACTKKRYDLYHETNYIPLEADCLTVATIHDLSVLHPEWHPADRVVHFERHFERARAGCAHFLAISEFTRQELIRQLGIPAQQVTRTYMGVRPGLGPLPKKQVAEILRQLGLPQNYLLYVGTIEPRKNVLFLLRAYCSLAAELRGRWPLLLVGNWGWNSGDVAAYFHDVARHQGVLQVGYLAAKHLPAVYNGARALVYPSLYEGFGLPPLEMMACGGPVLGSTAGALVEVIGGQAHLIHPEDLDGWREAMTRIVQDDGWRQALCQGVAAWARPFTWDRCAAETLSLYRALHAGTYQNSYRQAG